MGHSTRGAGAAGGNGASKTGPSPPEALVAAKALVGYALRGRLPWHARRIPALFVRRSLAPAALKRMGRRAWRPDGEGGRKGTPLKREGGASACAAVKVRRTSRGGTQTAQRQRNDLPRRVMRSRMEKR